MKLNAIDLFAGCGGLSDGLHQAGFKVLAAIEINKNAANTYRMNHSDTIVFEEDIRQFNVERIRTLLDGEPLHLLAGCPPCQGFSSIRRLNKKIPVEDLRNDLVLEYMRFIKELKPETIMMENVPGLAEYQIFKDVVIELRDLGYNPIVKIVNVANYGVPQRRRRLVLTGSLNGEIGVAEGTNQIKTVRDYIADLEDVLITTDPIHKIFPTHTLRVQEQIVATPKDGGSRRDLPKKYELKCHQKENVGFNDVYGRLRWDDVSSTITGGCMNPSKGRFLHPEENRCITAREAARLQTFPKEYKFPTDIPRSALALMIGNALPPEFSKIQAQNIYKHLKEHYND